MNTTYNIEVIVKQDRSGTHYFIGRNPANNSVEWHHNPTKALQFDRDDPWELSELLRELRYLTAWYAKHCPKEEVSIWPMKIQPKPSTP